MAVMGDFKSRLNNARVKLMRRASGTGSTGGTPGRSRRNSHDLITSSVLPTLHQPQLSSSLSKLPKVSSTADDKEPDNTTDPSVKEQPVASPKHEEERHRTPAETIVDRSPSLTSTPDPQTIGSSIASLPSPAFSHTNPKVIVEEPTPDPLPASGPSIVDKLARHDTFNETEELSPLSPLPPSRSVLQRPTAEIIRRQSLVTGSNARIINTLLAPATEKSPTPSAPSDYFTTDPPSLGMLHRKIWVKRPGASPTLVQIREDDLVDDVREMILKKYANSLGRNYDAPDVVLRIVPRDPNQRQNEHILGPELEMCRTLDAYYPGGQTVEEALIIDVPAKRTPRPSPRAHGHSYYYEDSRPAENASEYFPPMPVVSAPSPAALTADGRQSHAAHERSMSVLNTGQVPPLPSPGSTRRAHTHRPKYPRQHTSSPTALTGAPGTVVRPTNARPRHDSTASDHKSQTPNPPPLPTPPVPPPEAPAPTQPSVPPAAPRISSPRLKTKKRPKVAETPTLPSGLLDGSVPPINVLIVEDNMINLRVLGAFMERLKVRWQRAVNGREAVTKWRAGGFHLVLMDIQLPIMNGLEATKEIRRLERVNSIGVFSSASSEPPSHEGENGAKKELKEEDKLGDRFLFKSPVIIVALTASSLQSDRHEALAAGCNDFLTKPVNFVWLERKVKEWGCMQALIDYDGWRKWKDFAAESDSFNKEGKDKKEKEKEKEKAKQKKALPPTAAATAAAATSPSFSPDTPSTDGQKEEGPSCPKREKKSPMESDGSSASAGSGSGSGTGGEGA